MNNRGGIFLAVWFALALFIFGITFVNFIIPDVDIARTALDCASSTSISSGNKIMCLLVDIAVPYWIVLVLSISGGVVLDRLVT